MKCLENRILNEKKQKEKLLTCRSRAYYVSTGKRKTTKKLPLLNLHTAANEASWTRCVGLSSEQTLRTQYSQPPADLEKPASSALIQTDSELVLGSVQVYYKQVFPNKQNKYGLRPPTSLLI